MFLYLGWDKPRQKMLKRVKNDDKFKKEAQTNIVENKRLKVY